MKIELNPRIGGGDAGLALREQLVSFNERLGKLAGKVPASSISKISMFLFVSGEITCYPDPNGVGRLLVSSAKGTGRAEITMHQNVWKADSATVQRFLIDNVASAIAQVLARATGATRQSADQSLITELQRVLGRD